MTRTKEELRCDLARLEKEAKRLEWVFDLLADDFADGDTLNSAHRDSVEAQKKAEEFASKNGLECGTRI